MQAFTSPSGSTAENEPRINLEGGLNWRLARYHALKSVTIKLKATARPTDRIEWTTWSCDEQGIITNTQSDAEQDDFIILGPKQWLSANR